MKLELWFDFSCPYCYVGQKILKNVIDDLGKNVKIEYKAFQLEPDNSNHPTIFVEKMKQRNNLSESELDEKIEKMTRVAKNEDIPINPYSIIDVNTRTAHKVLKFTPDDKKDEIFSSIMNAYFVEGKDISDLEYLKEILGKHGVNFDGISKYNTSEEVEKELLIDRQEAEKIWFEKIPYARLENGKTLEGIFTVENVKNFLGDEE